MSRKLMMAVAMAIGLAVLPHPVAAEPTVIINEVDADTVSTDVYEFLELYDGGVGATPLDGLVLVFYNGNGDLSYRTIDLDGFTTDANGYFLVGNAAVTPIPDIIIPSNGIQNGADAVALYSDDAATFPNGTPVTTDNLIDAIVYDTDDADDPGLLVLLNPGQPQVNEDGRSNKDSDSSQRCLNGSGGLRNTETYAPRTPSPGAANACPCAFSNDADCDACWDTAEPALGPPANSSDPWDWYDVPVPTLFSGGHLSGDFSGIDGRDHAISIVADLLAVLEYAGCQDGGLPNAAGRQYNQDVNGDGVFDGRAYDRSVSGARSGAPDGAITIISDVLLLLAQAGQSCPPPT